MIQDPSPPLATPVAPAVDAPRGRGPRRRQAGLRLRTAILVSVAAHAIVVGIGGFVALRSPRPPVGVVERATEARSMAVPLFETESAETPTEPDPAAALAAEEQPPPEVAPDYLLDERTPASDEPPIDPAEAAPTPSPEPLGAVADDPLPNRSIAGVRRRPDATPRADSTLPTSRILERPSARPSAVAAATGRSPLRERDAPRPPFSPDTPEGTVLAVVLEYTIASDGRVTDARVVSSSGDASLDESTRSFVVARWRYEAPMSVRRVVRRFLFRRNAEGGQKHDAISAREISEGIMRGNDLTLLCRDC